MSVLLREIRHMDSGAASVLEQAKFNSDSEIQTLTREDLHELFPGPEKLKLRRNIFEKIHKQKPVQVLLKELQAFIPQEAFRAALTSHGVLVDYLHILKDMRTQLNNVQSFLDAHVDILENHSKDQSEQQQGQGLVRGGGQSDVQKSKKSNISGAPSSGSATDGWETLDRTNYNYGQNEASSEKTPTSTGNSFLSSFWSYNRTANTNAKGVNAKESNKSSDLFHADKYQHKMQVTQNTGRQEKSLFDRNPQKQQVYYKMVVSGKTFDAHLQILDRIQSITQQLNLVNMDKNPTGATCHITFVFCPVVSRVGTDVEAAMKEVEGSGPVILVLMHHSHEAKHVPSFKTWENGSDKAIEYQNVFYHEKLNGLISCKENDNAISAICKTVTNLFK